VLDEASLEYIRGLFARFKRDMPERNRVQALFPEGSRIIHNPNGTAPGIWIDIPRSSGGASHVFALPGVPAELFEMFRATVAPAVLSYQDKPRLIRHYRVKVFGAGESHVEQMLPDLIRRGREPSVGITVSAATITLRITASGATPEECLALIDPTVGTIRECLGHLVYGDEDDELEDAVVRLLKERGKTLCTVEYATAGLMAEWLSRASARESCYLGGHVIRSTAMLASELGDAAPLVESAGPASSEVVEALASACRVRSGADYCLVVGPFPESTPDDPAPPYHFALATPERVIVKASNMAGHNSIWLPRAAKAALNLLRLELLGAIH
jgi:nicotinamide-nucleotide amidase